MNVMFAVLLAAVGATGGAGAASDGGGRAKITSASTYYDRKEGYAYFSGRVFVDEATYKLHADRAYVFMEGTNELRRIVALGHVALTNESRRAYGEKVSYYREPGMVVLYGGENSAAEVRDVSAKGDQIVRGKKIKFWINSEQVEVLEAELSAPSAGGVKGLRSMIGR